MVGTKFEGIENEEQLIKCMEFNFPDSREWITISCFYFLSENFIRKYQDYIDFQSLSSLHENISDSFYEEFDEKFCFHYAYSSTVECDWMLRNEFHRTIGPAKIYKDGRCEFWYHGQKVKNVSNMEQYQRWLNLRLFA